MLTFWKVSLIFQLYLLNYISQMHSQVLQLSASILFYVDFNKKKYVYVYIYIHIHTHIYI